MGPTRATAVLALAAALCSAGCALAHERTADAATGASHRVCDRGAITYCVECERPLCCIHFCQEDHTWSACTYVENACPDGGPEGDSLGDRDR